MPVISPPHASLLWRVALLTASIVLSCSSGSSARPQDSRNQALGDFQNRNALQFEGWSFRMIVDKGQHSIVETNPRGRVERYGIDYTLGSKRVQHYLSLRPDGSVQSARLDPPLKPAFQACAGNLIGGRFEEGSREVTIAVTLGQP